MVKIVLPTSLFYDSSCIFFNLVKHKCAHMYKASLWCRNQIVVAPRGGDWLGGYSGIRRQRKMFKILIYVTVAQVYTLVKIHQSVNLSSVLLLYVGYTSIK